MRKHFKITSIQKSNRKSYYVKFKKAVYSNRHANKIEHSRPRTSKKKRKRSSKKNTYIYLLSLARTKTSREGDTERTKKTEKEVKYKCLSNPSEGNAMMCKLRHSCTCPERSGQKARAEGRTDTRGQSTRWLLTCHHLESCHRQTPLRFHSLASVAARCSVPPPASSASQS